MYSAFLALHAVETVDADGVVSWAHDRERLQAAWVGLAPVLQAKGLFIEMDDDNTSARASKQSDGACTGTGPSGPWSSSRGNVPAAVGLSRRAARQRAIPPVPR